ncbi:FAD-binding oxidoreductase [Bradyrhizobium elkanii]|uniref:FAD-binding oxidoreductase n=1 Tax=Bradyrhizobium elkanii TaxID=29448 RepID=UPI0027150752|nr:FAD-binding oxidoreductase [Bradyrhizobium elkanii]WLB05086.1 FAD-binding oxidoreductase [Bradyrhizobium elkanii]
MPPDLTVRVNFASSRRGRGWCAWGGQSLESPYHFPDMDRASAPSDEATDERPSPDTSPAPIRLPPLPTIPGCIMLRPGDTDFATHLGVYNARTQIAPALFAICATTNAVAAVFAWVKANHLPFAVRCGGHSYEGFSCSPGVVIDIKNLGSVTFDRKSMTVTVGAGASIGDIQKALKGKGVAFVAGTCPTVGISGHVMGGGYGLLARAYGLACDNLTAVTLVTAAGATVSASKDADADLFWASRGGGGGSLGIATGFVFAVHPISNVTVFVQHWVLPVARATRVVDAWQKWAPTADPGITALLKISRIDSSSVSLRCIGQSIAPPKVLDTSLLALEAVEPLSGARTLQTMSFWEAYKFFAGTGSDPRYQKEKSDFVPSLSPAAVTTLLAALVGQSSSQIALIFNAYGGAIDGLSESDTAFPHRRSISFMIHYYSGWDSGGATKQRLGAMSAFYAGMRPYVPGKAYINYCDSELQNWPTAYWGPNLGRLKAVKRTLDPGNVFRFPQSIPLV